MSSLYANSYIDRKLYAFDSNPQIMIKYKLSNCNNNDTMKKSLSVERRNLLIRE